MNSIKAITPDVEDSLARHKGGIELDGLVKLTKGGLAAKFVKPSSDLTVPLYFDELRQLTPEAAAGLALHAGDLWLNGLQTMSPEVAAALAKHKGGLGLSGLEWISVAAAQAIAQHEGPVVLTGLKGVSPESRNALLSNPGIKVGDDTDR